MNNKQDRLRILPVLAKRLCDIPEADFSIIESATRINPILVLTVPVRLHLKWARTRTLVFRYNKQIDLASLSSTNDKSVFAYLESCIHALILECKTAFDKAKDEKCIETMPVRFDDFEGSSEKIEFENIEWGLGDQWGSGKTEDGAQ